MAVDQARVEQFLKDIDRLREAGILTAERVVTVAAGDRELLERAFDRRRHEWDDDDNPRWHHELHAPLKDALAIVLDNPYGGAQRSDLVLVKSGWRHRWQGPPVFRGDLVQLQDGAVNVLLQVEHRIVRERGVVTLFVSAANGPVSAEDLRRVGFSSAT